MDGILRFLQTLFIILITIGIITEPALPGWVAKRSLGDEVHTAYYSLIYMFHMHNHPVMNAFLSCFGKLIINYYLNYY